VVIRYNVTRAKLLATLPKLFDGSHIHDPAVEYYQTDKFSLLPKHNETLNIDGELLGSTPIDVMVKKHAIQVYDRKQNIE